MQEDNFKDFDLKIKAIIEDAEMRPSRSVWKSVSTRLEASSTPKSQNVWTWMQWAGVSCATVTAVLVGFFILRDSGNQKDVLSLEKPQSAMIAQTLQPFTSSTDNITESAELEIANELRGVVDGLEEVTATFELAETSSQRDNKSTEDIIEIVGLSGSEVKSDPAPQDEKSTPTVESRPKETSKSTSKKTSEPIVVTRSSDLFAEMVMEDEQQAKQQKLSLYAHGLIGGNDSNIRVNSVSMLAPGSGLSTGITELSESVYGIPFSLGIGIRFPLFHNFSIGTGIDYSLLTRTFSGKYSEVSGGMLVKTETGSVAHALHYIGIPVNIFYGIVENNTIKFYTYIGGELDYCISNSYTLFGTPNIVHRERVNKFQPSVGIGLGVEFTLSNTLGLYLDPGLRYYFPSGQPKSVRTDRPVMANFNAGLRFFFK